MCCVPGAHRASGYKNEYVLAAPTMSMEWLTQSPYGPRDLRIGAHETHQTPAMAASLTRVWFGTTLAIDCQRRTFLSQELIKFIQLRSTWPGSRVGQPNYVAYPPRIRKNLHEKRAWPGARKTRNCRSCSAGKAVWGTFFVRWKRTRIAQSRPKTRPGPGAQGS
jgi:hypothetical protein